MLREIACGQVKKWDNLEMLGQRFLSQAENTCDNINVRIRKQQFYPGF